MMNKKGYIKALPGGMRSGKSEEINRRIKRAKIAGMKVQAFKPDKDNRFSEGEIVSRDDRRVECTIIPSENPEYILSVLEEGVQLVIIDEVQFFKPRYMPVPINEDTTESVLAGEFSNAGVVVLKEHYPIVDVVQKLADSGINVIVAGLDMDSERKPFGAMPYILAIADEIRKLHAVCEICHSQAMYSYANFDKGGEQIVVGDEGYIAVCRNCYVELQQPDTKVTLVDEDECGRRLKIVKRG